MSEFKLESGVPIPKVSRVTKGSTKYPFESMNVGDSFAVPMKDASVETVLNRVRAATFRYAKDYGGKFTVRVMDDETVRIWRIG